MYVASHLAQHTCSSSLLQSLSFRESFVGEEGTYLFLFAELICVAIRSETTTMKFPAKQTVFLLASVFFLSVSADSNAPKVHTALGSLRGEYVSVKGKVNGVHAFLGVPFAKPPVGPASRLSVPQPVEGWEGMRDATQQPPMCIQPKQVLIDLIDKLGGMAAEVPDVSEDCLYLNIYTPANRANGAKLPVMVWIHGGGFTLGSASVYDGSALAAYQNVVVVLIQYRLGILGFLSTGDEHMSGNFGLLDQVEALRWVQQHIHSFGGNPDSVTIFGESAGGVSVSLLLLSPLTDGLIQHAIAESGTAAMDVLVLNDPLPVTQNERLRYPINVDGHFLTKPVDELFQKHELLTVPFMTGVNNDEGGWLLFDAFAPKNWTEGLDLETVKNMLMIFYPDPAVLDVIIDEYIGTGEDRVRNRNGYAEALGDIIFTLPAIKCANGHRDAGAPVYLYEYQYPPKFLQEKRPSFVRADHGDEVFTVFGFCFTTKHVTLKDGCPEEEEELSKIMMSYWGNFARTGSPNGEGLSHWPKYGAEEHYLKIDLKEQVRGYTSLRAITPRGRTKGWASGGLLVLLKTGRSGNASRSASAPSAAQSPPQAPSAAPLAVAELLLACCCASLCTCSCTPSTSRDSSSMLRCCSKSGRTMGRLRSTSRVSCPAGTLGSPCRKK
uniref:Carboxylic ester hydrolase n=1 Tax=Labrus bergylta TaxID=56723 RepID=A0A3Q3DZC8_9LABR